MNIKLILVSLSAVLSLQLSGCVTVPDVRACSVAGVMSAGMNCAQTGSEATDEMDLSATLDFLEPQINPPRGGAICISSEDYERQSVALESACYKLGPWCSYEVRKNISQVKARLSTLKTRSMKKPREGQKHETKPDGSSSH